MGIQHAACRVYGNGGEKVEVKYYLGKPARKVGFLFLCYNEIIDI